MIKVIWDIQVPSTTIIIIIFVTTETTTIIIILRSDWKCHYLSQGLLECAVHALVWSMAL